MASASASRTTLLETLRRLAETDGPPGREGAVRRLAEEHLSSAGIKPRLSPLGSVYAERGASGGARVLLAAHLDEVGFVVSHVDRGGVAWLHPAGRVRVEECVGAGLRFPHAVRAMLGLTASAPTLTANASRPLADFGSRQQNPPVRPGDMAVFDTAWEVEKNVARGKALDGRVGVALALQAAIKARRAALTLALALTSLGQVGQRSARAAAEELGPDVILTLGTLAVGEGRKPGETMARAGKGPAILVRGSQFVADARLSETLMETAARARLPYQVVVCEDPTGAAEMQAALEGVPVATILVPCQGVGTPRQQVDIVDLEAALELVLRVLGRLPPG